MSTATETSISTRTGAEIGEHRFVIHNLGWKGSEALLELFRDDGPRMSYSRGNVELKSPLIPHERYGKLLGFIVEAIVEELDIPANAPGSTTYQRRLADRGHESDGCYYIANAGELTSLRRPDLEVDPPPDLAIEVEINSGLLHKLDLYARLGVPELWRFDGEALDILLLQPDRAYSPSDRSASFPFLPMGEILRFLRDPDFSDEGRWARGFRAWVREVLVPLHRNPADPE